MAGSERTSVMSTDHGRIVVVTPERLTEADVDDFELWVELLKRGMRRRAQEHKAGPTTSNNDNGEGLQDA